MCIKQTFNNDTKSAVSNKVNWEMLSTICEIFGLLEAAAVDCHLLRGIITVAGHVHRVAAALVEVATASRAQDLDAKGMGGRAE